LEDIGLTEEEEKLLAGVKKSSEDISDAKARFECSTIEPVRRPMVECDKLITEAMFEAHRRESEAPLIEIGLVEMVKMEVARMPRPRWNDEDGRLEIVQPALS
jgi:hypothetical protein